MCPRTARTVDTTRTRPIVFCALLMLAGGATARAQEHVSIFSEQGRSVRLAIVDAQGKPLANEQVELREIECDAGQCRPVVIWSRQTDAEGSVVIPRSLIHEGVSIGTPTSEPRGLQAASWRPNRHSWVLGLMGHAGTICTSYDNPITILVSDDWRSALVNTADEFGLMACTQAKDAFRSCVGPQVPDAGLAATITRTGDRTAMRLTGESIAGPHELARLDCWRLARAEPPPRHPASFALEYSLTGGQAALNRHLRITQAGDLAISANTTNYATVLHARASADLMAAIAAFLNAARPAQPAAPRALPDAIDSSLALIAGGARYTVELPHDLAQRLGDVLTSQLTNAIVGAWRQSGWKLCRPTDKLTADQMDPPIDRLEFLPGGEFSVTWRGGGARVYDDPSGTRPHTVVPDYSGRYGINPDRGRIRLTFESGVYTPRDFAGDGFYRVAEDTLRLTRVWLGTFKAKQRPDICELSFVRIARQ